MGRALQLVSVFVLALAVLASGGVARAEEADKAQCASAYEVAQEHRAAGRLHKARESLVVCAQQACPAFVQTDCGQWLTEVDREMPSIVIAAKDKEGNDTTSVRVFVDDQPLLESLGGTAVTVDPGMHQFRFELEGAEPIVKKIVIRQGQKNRDIDVSWAPKGAEPALDSPYDAPADEQAVEPDTTAESAEPGPLRPYAFIAGGVGAAGLISFAVFGALGQSQKSDLEEECSPNCTDDELAPVKTKFLIADISLGVGIAGVATGVVLFFLSMPSSDDSAAADDAARLSVDVGPARGGGFASLSGRF